MQSKLESFSLKDISQLQSLLLYLCIRLVCNPGIGFSFQEEPNYDLMIYVRGQSYNLVFDLKVPNFFVTHQFPTLAVFDECIRLIGSIFAVLVSLLKSFSL